MRNIDTSIARYSLGLIVFSVIPVKRDEDYSSANDDEEYEDDSRDINKNPVIGWCR